MEGALRRRDPLRADVKVRSGCSDHYQGLNIELHYTPQLTEAELQPQTSKALVGRETIF